MPVHTGLAPLELGCIRGAVGRLGCRLDQTGFQSIQRLHDQLRAKVCEPIVQRSHGIVLQYRNLFLNQHRAGVEPCVHLHDRYAGVPIAGKERPLNGRCAAPSRQQGRVNIDRPVPSKLEHRLWKNQAVGGNDDDVGPEMLELRLRPRVSQTLRLAYPNAPR